MESRVEVVAGSMRYVDMINGTEGEIGADGGLGVDEVVTEDRKSVV